MQQPTAGWTEGQDGTVVRYREVQRPHWGLVAATVALSASLGIAYGYALGTTAGLVTTAAALVGTALLLRRATVVVQVDDRVLRVGPARLPLDRAGPARALDREEAARRRGPEADARAYLALRSWLPLAVLVPVDDARDPHPYWLVSTRDPAGLVAAVTGARPTVEHP